MGKIIIRASGEEIKLEVNLVARGTLHPPERMVLCEKAQQSYNTSSVMQIVPFGQLYGGKICATLDRQHPRDLFDVKLLLETEGFSDTVREGFLLCLLSGNRPIHEILAPNFQNQQQTFKNQFTGMTDIVFSYCDFKQTRTELVTTINANLTQQDKEFLLSFENCEPDWSIHNFARFPAVKWKLQNRSELKQEDSEKHLSHYERLEKTLR